MELFSFLMPIFPVTLKSYILALICSTGISLDDLFYHKLIICHGHSHILSVKNIIYYSYTVNLGKIYNKLPI